MMPTCLWGAGCSFGDGGAPVQPAKTTAAALFGAGDQWLREAPASAGGLPPATQDLLAIAQRVGRGAVLLRTRAASLEYIPPRKNKENTYIYDHL